MQALRDQLTRSTGLIHGWLESLEAGSAGDALITPASLQAVAARLAASMRAQAAALPDGQLSERLSQTLLARGAELEFSARALSLLDIGRTDARWPELLLAWVRAAELSGAVCASMAQDIAKRLKGPRVRHAQADENNSTLINAIVFYRLDPRTDKPRSARNIAAALRRNSGFDGFTRRRSDEALTRLVQRILRKVAADSIP